MNIRAKAVMPDGTSIQLEDWADDYPNTEYAWMIGAYPVAKHTSDRYFGPQKGKPFRVSLGFAKDNEAVACMEALNRGEKTLVDYADRMWDPKDVEFIKD